MAEENVDIANERLTGCEIDAPLYAFRGNWSLLFPLWLRIDGGATHQLYWGMRHAVPLAAGRHEIEIEYGGAALRGGRVETTIDVHAGGVVALTYSPPFFSPFFPGKIKKTRRSSRFRPADWVPLDGQRFAPCAVLPYGFHLNPASSVETGRIPEKRRRFWRRWRTFQHHLSLNMLTCCALLLVLWVALLIAIRFAATGVLNAFWVVAFLTLPAGAWWMLHQIPRDGQRDRVRKRKLLGTISALAVLLMATFSGGWRPLTAEEGQRQIARDHSALQRSARDSVAGGRYDDAIEALEKARELVPTDARGRMDLARAYARNGRHKDAAVRELRAAYELDPSATLFNIHRGRLSLTLRHHPAYRAWVQELERNGKVPRGTL